MRILTSNEIKNNSSITMTNPNADYSLSSIYSNILEEVVQAASNSTVITVNFDTDIDVNAIFFGYHNASSVVFTFKSSTGSTLSTETFSFPNVYAKRYIDKVSGIRSIEISMSTSEQYIFIGNISCGVYTQLYNVRLPITVEHKDTSVFSKTDGGQFLQREGIILQSFKVSCDKLTDDQVSDFEESYLDVHKGGTFWMDRNEDLDSPLFGSFTANYSTTRVSTLTTLNFSFEEAR